MHPLTHTLATSSPKLMSKKVTSPISDPVMQMFRSSMVSHQITLVGAAFLWCGRIMVMSSGTPKEFTSLWLCQTKGALTHSIKKNKTNFWPSYTVEPLRKCGLPMQKPLLSFKHYFTTEIGTPLYSGHFLLVPNVSAFRASTVQCNLRIKDAFWEKLASLPHPFEPR